MKNVFVTGGGGFVGRALLRELVGRGYRCATFSRGSYSDLEEMGVVCFQGDLGDSSFVQQCLKGYDTVFHVASLTGIWGDYKKYYRTNVEGAHNILQGCLRHKIKRLIYTSTPSVVFAGKDICGEDEGLPYARKFLCNYAKTKAIAEKNVLAANNDELLTCALRPHLIWGPGDPHLVPRLLDRARDGKLKIVGDGCNKVDITYIDNVVHAHLLAADELEGEGKCAGKAYFIGQERSVEMWKWINDLLDKCHVDPVEKSVPLPIAYGAGAFLECMYRVTKQADEPKMTRFLALQLARSHYFTHDLAKKDFGYSPLVAIEDGMVRLLTWLKENEKNM